MTNKDEIIDSQAEQIIFLKRKVERMEVVLRNLGVRPGEINDKLVNELREKHGKKNNLPGWVRSLLD